MAFANHIIDCRRKHKTSRLFVGFLKLQVSYLYEPFEVKRIELNILKKNILIDVRLESVGYTVTLCHYTVIF